MVFLARCVAVVCCDHLWQGRAREAHLLELRLRRWQEYMVEILQGLHGPVLGGPSDLCHFVRFMGLEPN